jgi:hypothetical protein
MRDQPRPLSEFVSQTTTVCSSSPLASCASSSDSSEDWGRAVAVASAHYDWLDFPGATRIVIAASDEGAHCGGTAPDAADADEVACASIIGGQSGVLRFAMIGNPAFYDQGQMIVSDGAGQTPHPDRLVAGFDVTALTNAISNTIVATACYDLDCDLDGIFDECDPNDNSLTCNDFQPGTTPLRICLRCDEIDFNNDGSAYDPADTDAFLSVFSEGPCIPVTATCNDMDFNNDCSSFDPGDVDAFLSAFSEGPCPLNP